MKKFKPGDDYKNCSRCKKRKSVNFFYPHRNKNGDIRPSSYCKKCSREVAERWVSKNREKAYKRNKKWRDANKEKVSRGMRAWYSRVKHTDAWRRKRHETYLANREAMRFSQMKHMYGLSKEQFLILFKSQSGKCAVCYSKFDGMILTKNSPHIDHCHSTNRVRGLLCKVCNLTLGKLRDNEAGLRSALAYLRKPGITPDHPSHHRPKSKSVPKIFGIYAKSTITTSPKPRRP